MIIKKPKYYLSIFLIIISVGIPSCYEPPNDVGLVDNISPKVVLLEPKDKAAFSDVEKGIYISVEAKDFWGINNIELVVNNYTLTSDDYFSNGFIKIDLLLSDSINTIWAIAHDVNGNQGISNKIGIYFNKTIILKKNLDTLIFKDNAPTYTLDLNDYFQDTLMKNSTLEYTVSYYKGNKGKVNISGSGNLIFITPVRYFEGERLIEVTAQNGDRTNNIEFVVKVVLSAKVKKIYIPDDRFRNRLITRHNFADFNEDSVALQQVKELTKLELFNNGYLTKINNFDGLQYFTNLIELNVSGNEIKDFTVNTLLKLKKLDCSNNYLKTLDVSMLENLEELNLIFNYNLKKLNVTQNTQLKNLFCNLNMDNIDLSKNIKLEKLTIDECSLNRIDLSSNVNLKYLAIYSHTINDLDLNANINLEKLMIGNSLLKKLDISNNQKLTSINLSNNELLIKTIVWTLPLPDYINVKKDDKNIFVTN